MLWLSWECHPQEKLCPALCGSSTDVFGVRSQQTELLPALSQELTAELEGVFFSLYCVVESKGCGLFLLQPSSLLEAD